MAEIHDKNLTQTKPSITPTSISRQNFFTLVWKSLLGLSGALGLVGLWRYLSYQPYSMPRTSFDLGPVEDLPPGEFIPIPEAQAMLLNTSDGLIGLSLICPHLGCVVETTESDFTCPCHGSRFEHNGSLIVGPANQPLRILSLKITEDGHLQLDTSEG